MPGEWQEVSIPYSTIKIWPSMKIIFRLSAFQFLIVRLKYASEYSKFPNSSFQFLIVRLKCNKMEIARHIAEFQFLIVRLKFQSK